MYILSLLLMIQELVMHMTQKDPSLRQTADQYLSNQRGKAFPEYFYTFLGLYCQRFAQMPIIHSDDRVARLYTAPSLMFYQYSVLLIHSPQSLL